MKDGGGDPRGWGVCLEESLAEGGPRSCFRGAQGGELRQQPCLATRAPPGPLPAGPRDAAHQVCQWDWEALGSRRS